MYLLSKQSTLSQFCLQLNLIAKSRVNTNPHQEVPLAIIGWNVHNVQCKKFKDELRLKGKKRIEDCRHSPFMAYEFSWAYWAAEAKIIWLAWDGISI